MRDKPLTLINRLGALKSRHTALEDRIRDELARPMPDTSRAQMLKRMRLRLRLRTKDHIALIARQLTLRPWPYGPEAA